MKDQKDQEERERRDWVMLPVIVLLGILFMFQAGQRAISLSPSWEAYSNMNSNLDPNARYKQAQGGDQLEPLRPEILTPPSWAGTFLTPGANSGAQVVAVSNSPTPLPPTPTAVAASPTPAAPTPTTVVTVAPTYPPVEPVVEKKKKKSNPPPPTAIPPSPTPEPTLTTLDTTIYTKKDPVPASLNVGDPDGNITETTSFPNSTYFVVNVSANPVKVSATPDGNYDLVYYEVQNPISGTSNKIAMDQVSVGITNDATGKTYYEVFNWGDGKPDTNSNVDTTKLSPPSDNNPAEVDNQVISTDDLYKDPAATPPPDNPQTGILIDVDKAPSHPPPDDYNYVVIVAPPTSNPGNTTDGGQVDSIDVTEVPIPATPP